MADKTVLDRYPNLLKRFNTRRPKWANPAQFLPPPFQNLFELSYFQESGVPIPVGWNYVDLEKKFPRISTRLPKPASDVDMRSPGACASDDSSSDEATSQPSSPAMTRMVDESDEDSDFPKAVVSGASPVCALLGFRLLRVLTSAIRMYLPDLVVVPEAMSLVILRARKSRTPVRTARRLGNVLRSNNERHRHKRRR